MAAVLVFYMVRNLFAPVILAILVAYLLNPLVERFVGLRLPRTLATVLAYFILMIVLALGTSVLVHLVRQQVSSIYSDLQAIYEGLRRLTADYETIYILGYSIDLSAIFETLQSSVQDSLNELVRDFPSRSVEVLFGVAGVAGTLVAGPLVWLIFILIVSFWLVKDADKMSSFLDGFIPLDYREEIERLRGKLADVWNSFFRGLLLLSFTVGVITGVTMWLVGVKNAVLLGMLAGLLEVVPTLGPIIAAIPGIAIALFQGSAHLPIGSGWFALLVLGLYVMIQQVENNLLTPRIIGASVKIHPLLVLVGAIGGYSIGGILGAFLAAPVIGTSRILGEYIYRKLVEVEPAPEVPKAVEKPGDGTEYSSGQTSGAEQGDGSS